MQVHIQPVHIRPEKSQSPPTYIQFMDWVPYTHAQQTEIIAFGTSKKGHSCCVRFQHFPFTYSIMLPTKYHKAFDQYLQRNTFQSFQDNILDKPKSHYLKNIMGFHPEAEPVLTYSFNMVNAWQWSARRLRQLTFPLQINKHKTIRLSQPNPTQLTLLNTSIDPVLQFLHTNKWTPMGWIDITTLSHITTLVRTTGRISRCSYEWIVKWNSPLPPMIQDDSTIAPFVMASFDIECVSAKRGFPMPEKEDDPVIQIATTVQRVGETDPCLFHIISLGSVQPFRFAKYNLLDTSFPASSPTSVWAPETVPPTHHPRTKKPITSNDWHITAYQPVIIEAYTSERDVLIAWTQLLQAIDPDIILGYNIFGFDINYLFTRPRILLEQEYYQWVQAVDHLKSLSPPPTPEQWKNHVNTLRNQLAKSKREHLFFDNLVQSLEYTTVQDIQSKKLDYYIPEQWDETQFSQMSRIIGHKATLREKTMESNAYGHNDYRLVDTYGRVWLDVFQIVKKEHKLSSYKLDYVGNYFVGQKKVDMSPYELFRLFQEGGEKGRTNIAIYCVQDTYLPLRIIDHLLWIHNNIAMSNVCLVPMNTLILQAQQIKVFSQLANLAREKGFGIPESERTDDIFEEKTKTQKYQGATVLTAQRGAYGFQAKPSTNFPIAGLDFASLYPSVMIGFNLCYTTLIDDTQLTPQEKERLQMEIIEWKDEKDPTITYHYAFVQAIREEDGTFTPYKGILPQLLSNLLSTRKTIKRSMACEQDPIRKSIYNGQQLAVKISANSVYGFTGAVDKGILPCRPIAMCTTTLGRRMIETSKNYAESNYNAQVIYGDSITGKTRVQIKYSHSNHHTRIPIQSLFDEMQQMQQMQHPMIRYHDKEYINTSILSTPLLTWSDKGWTPIKALIRHKLNKSDTIKHIFRIRTQSGASIEVTEDHSLLMPQGQPICPKDCHIGDVLLACEHTCEHTH